MVIASVVFFHEVATHHYRIDGYATSRDGRQLMIGYTYGKCEMWRKESLVEESSDRVVVAATYVPTVWTGACEDIGYEGTATFELDEPLGDRDVFYEDGESLTRLPIHSAFRPGEVSNN
jgi:hypothetical protein